jgi:hypothetical protein
MMPCTKGTAVRSVVPKLIIRCNSVPGTFEVSHPDGDLSAATLETFLDNTTTVAEGPTLLLNNGGGAPRSRLMTADFVVAVVVAGPMEGSDLPSIPKNHSFEAATDQPTIKITLLGKLFLHSSYSSSSSSSSNTDSVVTLTGTVIEIMIGDSTDGGAGRFDCQCETAAAD